MDAQAQDQELHQPNPLHKQAQDQDDHHNAHTTHSATTHVAVVASTNSSGGSNIVDPDPWYYNARGCAMSLSAFWTLCCGISVALVAFFPSFFLAWATDYKFELFDRVQEKSGIGALLGVSVMNAVIFAGISAGIIVVGKCSVVVVADVFFLRHIVTIHSRVLFSLSSCL
jgi:hypothetical protein